MALVNSLDVTLTAVLRPEVLDRTLASFTANMDLADSRLIMNVDPVGDGNYLDVLAVAKKHFLEVEARFPDKPSFPLAVMWCWEQVQTDIFLHLEDDWVLDKLVSVDRALGVFREYPRLADLRLPAYWFMQNFVLDTDGCPTTRPWHYEPRLGVCFAEGRKPSFSLNPSFRRADFVKGALPMMDAQKNPEKQFKWGNPPLKKWCREWRHGLYGCETVMHDIGRAWLLESEWRKPSNDFVAWEEP